MNDSQEQHQLAPFSMYIKIWLALIVLTGITVGVSLLDLQKFTIFTAMLIATLKASLVILYFMHIRFENRFYHVLIIATLLFYSIFIILTFADYSYR